MVLNQLVLSHLSAIQDVICMYIYIYGYFVEGCYSLCVSVCISVISIKDLRLSGCSQSREESDQDNTSAALDPCSAHGFDDEKLPGHRSDKQRGMTARNNGKAWPKRTM